MHLAYEAAFEDRLAYRTRFDAPFARRCPPYDGTPLVTEGLGATKLLGDRKETTPASSLSMVTVGSPSFHFPTTDSFTRSSSMVHSRFDNQ